MLRRGLIVRFLIGASRTLGGFWNGLPRLFRLACQLHEQLKRLPHQALELIRLKIRHMIGRQILPASEPAIYSKSRRFSEEGRDMAQTLRLARCAGSPPCLPRAKEKAPCGGPSTLAISEWSDRESPALCSAAERRIA